MATSSKWQWYKVTQREHERNIARGARSKYRRTVAETREADKAIKATRNKRLKKASTTCKAERKAAQKKVTTKCKARRDGIRGTANAELGKTKRKREQQRRDWLWRSGAVQTIQTAEKRYTQSESDSLALHNIPTEYHGLFKKTRKQWTYAKEPDQRAELFMEWVQGEPEIAVAWLAAQVPTDVAYARAYSSRLEDELEEAVPF